MSPADLFSVDLLGFGYCSCVFGVDPFDLRYSASPAVVILVRWSYAALAR